MQDLIGLTVRLDVTTSMKLEYLARTTQTAKYDIIRKALEQFLEKNPTISPEENGERVEVHTVFTLPRKLFEELDKYAAEHKVTKARVVREALREYLKDVKIPEDTIIEKPKKLFRARIPDEVIIPLKEYIRNRNLTLSKLVERVLTDFVERNYNKHIFIPIETDRKKPVQTLMVRLPKDLVEKINELALKNNEKRNEIVRVALEEFLEKIEEEEATAKSVS
ncbi:MAG: ribbon-helix-helix protein, CopG family [Candidatus Rehaiarchaeum fermentans]|nr:ribbon-helix-helix domain-containing protein [Candidatus Rehaiarchaeum fermentans]